MPDPSGYGRVLRDGGRVVGIVEEKDADPQQREVDEIAVSTYAFDGDALTRALGFITVFHRGRGWGRMRRKEIPSTEERMAA